MRYEREYIKFLITESFNKTALKKTLEDYLLDKIDFKSLTDYIYENPKLQIIDYKTFEKNLNIDSLLS